MTDMTVSRPGQVDAAGDANALFLKMFAGEVLTAFDEVNVMRDLHLARTLDKGKSASFPATWKANASYHTPGNLLTGANQIKHGERIISVDDLLVSDVFIAQIDEAKNHYEVRSIYSKQVGDALARTFDKKTMQVAVLAARAASTIDDGFGGSTLFGGATAATDGTVLAGLYWTAAQTFDEKDIPDSERYGILKPAQFHLLAQTEKIINRDYNGGATIYRDGAGQLFVAGINIKKSNNVPTTVIAAVTGENNTYSGTFTDVVSPVFHRSAFGTVKLMDLAVQKTADDGDFAAMYQGTLVVAKYAMGHGILRPESAIEISKAAS